MDLSEQIETKLLDWKLTPEVKVYRDKDNLEVKVHFKKDKNNSPDSFFYDPVNNQTVILMLGKTFFDDLKKYQKVTYTFRFENPITLISGSTMHIEDFNYSMSEKELTENYDLLETNPAYYNLVENAFKHLGNKNLELLDSWIRILKSEYELINYNGSFLHMLFDYSTACNNHEKAKQKKIIYEFLVVLKSASNPDEPRYIPSKVFKYYLDHCNLPETLLDVPLMNIPDELFQIFKDEKAD